MVRDLLLLIGLGTARVSEDPLAGGVFDRVAESLAQQGASPCTCGAPLTCSSTRWPRRARRCPASFATACSSAAMATACGASRRWRCSNSARGPKDAQLYSQLVALYNWAQSSDHAATAAMQARAGELASDLEGRVAAIDGIREGSVAVPEQAVAGARLPRLVLPALAP